MRTYFECIPCFIRQVLDAVRMTSDDQQVQLQVLRKALRLASEADLTQSPPAMAQQIHRYIRELTADPDPYIEVKDKFNKIALQMYPDLRTRIEKSIDPLETAVRLAIAGNINDFGVTSNIEESHVPKTVAESLEAPLDLNALDDFRKAVTKAKNILYLGDNAGEIVFDRLLVEQLPYQKIAFVVKNGPVINDATIDDALITGMTDVVEVIDNGSDAPGTILDSCSEQFRDRFDNTELIIAKGQGNYETLSDVDKDVFFLLRAKCPVAARHIGCEIGDMVLSRNTIKTGAKKP
ncbi:MAG: DUF89 family protein [Sedimentisphaerales bacterium]|nr:DUF89 family protein [Sedimentisphaerales bacterium]